MTDTIKTDNSKVIADLQAENEALVARGARVRFAVNNMLDAKQSDYVDAVLNLQSVLNETESESLTGIKAAAVLEFSKDLVDEYPAWKKLLPVADNYANQLRQKDKDHD